MDKTFSRIRQFIPEEFWLQVLKYRLWMNENSSIHPAILESIHHYQWLKLLMPIHPHFEPNKGGMEILRQTLTLEHALAYTNGSVGWFVTLCSGAGWFSGFLSEPARLQFMEGNSVCWAGSAEVGTAVEIEGGYLVNGFWRYATGIQHATAVTANVQCGDQVFSIIVPVHQVEQHLTWKMSGMKATGSHAFSITNATVFSHQTFLLQPDRVTLSSPIYTQTFSFLALATLSANVVGIAERFLSELAESAPQSSSQQVQLLTMQSALAEQWTAFLAELSPLPDDVETRLANMIKTAKEAVDQSVPFAGLGLMKTGSLLNQFFLDFHTALQHKQVLYLLQKATRDVQPQSI